MQLASSIDSLVRVSRRAESATARINPGQAPLPSAPGPIWGISKPDAATTIRMVQSPHSHQTPSHGGPWVTGTPEGMPGPACCVLSHRVGRPPVEGGVRAAPIRGPRWHTHTPLALPPHSPSLAIAHSNDHCKPQALASRVPPHGAATIASPPEDGGSAASPGLAQGRLG